jgi:hypothetical protein
MPKRAPKSVDPLPLEAAHRALRERLAREPFGSPEIEEKIADMWDEISIVRAKAWLIKSRIVNAVLWT